MVKRARRWPRGWAREGQPHRGQWFPFSSHLVGGKPPLLSKEQEQWTQGAGPCRGRAARGRDGCGLTRRVPQAPALHESVCCARAARPESPPCGCRCRCSPVERQDRLGLGLQARSIPVPLCQSESQAEPSEPLKEDARGRTQAGSLTFPESREPPPTGHSSCPPNRRT